jgi:lipopolysaccharide cholinephosphotransferase
MDAASLRRLQLAELVILKEFVRICEVNDLRYYLAYGTLLGAVRHSGFIPWDDDIDVAMPRSAYRKFIAACDTQLLAGYTWHSNRTDTKHGMFGKLIFTETVSTDAQAPHRPYQQAPFIDVFPLDGLPSGRLGREIHRLLVKLCTYRLQLGFVRRRGLGRLLEAATTAMPRDFAITLIERLGSQFPFERSRVVYSSGGPYGYSAESGPGEVFGKGTALSFEGLVAVGPTDWNAHLTRLYGDYMTMPPEDSRKGHHDLSE